ELLERRDRQLNRTLDLRSDRCRAVEIARQENRFEQRSYFVVVVAQHSSELVLRFRSDLLANEVSVNLAGDESRRNGLLENNVDHINAVEIAGLAQERL